MNAKQFIKGAEETGHTVEIFDTAHMDMNPCLGCGHCGMEGECVHNDDICRADREQNDDPARPDISSSIENCAEYGTIIIGHPIWWGIEPRIMDIFMEGYDFSGKNIAHFCTSGGSGISSSDSNLQAHCPDSNWLGEKNSRIAARSTIG